MVKIAIVEDDIAICELYRIKFELERFEVVTAHNGKDGLSLVRKESPDLVLLDLMMPIMGGDEMLRELRAGDKAEATRVVILTNLSKSEAPASLRFLRVERYIIKAHTTPAQVVDTVRAVLHLNK